MILLLEFVHDSIEIIFFYETRIISKWNFDNYTCTYTCTLRLQEISFQICNIMLTNWKFILLIPVHVMSILYNLSQIWSTSVTGMWRIYQVESFRDLPVPWCASRRLICRSISPVKLHVVLFRSGLYNCHILRLHGHNLITGIYIHNIVMFQKFSYYRTSILYYDFNLTYP